MMSPEDTFAKKVAQALDEGLDELDPLIQSKLSQARARAMQAHGRPASAPLFQGGSTLALAQGQRFKLPQRAAAALVALALCFSGWSAHSQWINANAEAAADLDAQILADDAPLQAYSDPLFSMTVRQGLLKNRASR